MIHHLKILPEFYEAVIENRKPFEIRENDRNFKSGDIVILEEFIKTEHVPYCSHFNDIIYDVIYDEETQECPYENCEECEARYHNCHDYINHIYTRRTCTIRIKDVFNLNFMLPNYVAFTFDVLRKSIKSL